MHSPAKTYTLADYERSTHYPVRKHDQLEGCKRCLFEPKSDTIWASWAIASFVNDHRKSEAAFRRRFMRAVEVVIIEDLRQDWKQAM